MLIKQVMIFIMWYPFRVLVRIIPLKFTYLLGVAGGWILFLISRKKRKIMEEELMQILPQEKKDEIGKIVKDCFVNYCLSEMEVLLYPVLNEEFIKKHFTIIGKNHLDNAISRKKGVLLFQAHFGAFQMVMPAIGYSGYKMNQISASASIWKDSSSSEILKKSYDIKASYEYTLPVNHISIRSSLRPVFKALGKNEIVGVTVDGGGGKKIVLVNFLGRKAYFQKGAADLAIRTGAEIVPAFIITEKGLRHRLVLHSPISVNKELSREDNIKTILQEFVKILESFIYSYPTHYGYTLCLRKSRAFLDDYPFFEDYSKYVNNNLKKIKVKDYA